MKLDRARIVGLLRARGDDAGAERGERELPEQVDTVRDADLLAALGLDPLDLLRSGGGLGGALRG